MANVNWEDRYNVYMYRNLSVVGMDIGVVDDVGIQLLFNFRTPLKGIALTFF